MGSDGHKERKASARRTSRLRVWWSGGGAGRRAIGRCLAWLAAGGLLAGGMMLGLRALERRVIGSRPTWRREAGTVRVDLAHVPNWMPDALARQIVRDLTPPGASLADAQLAQKVYDRAIRNPWVRRAAQVVVRLDDQRRTGLVEAHLEFRRPIARVARVARVQTAGEFVHVDAEGYVLPPDQVPQHVITFRDENGRMVRQRSYLALAQVPAALRSATQSIHYIMIDGVAAAPRPPGGQWAGRDLAEGLRLVELLRRRLYHDQVTLVDVRNHACRITKNEPELRLYAQIGQGRATEIRFGRFPVASGGDYVISPERKLSYLDQYVAAHRGQLAGLNSYLDLRYDQLHVSIN